MNFPGEQLVIKLWETLVEKGIGAYLAPWQSKRVGKARNEVRRDEMLLLAQTEKELNDIRAGRATFTADGGFKLLENQTEKAGPQSQTEAVSELSLLAVRAINNELGEAIRKELNVARSVLIAEEILAQDSQKPPEESIDDDWLFSWRDYAGRVTSEELQDLWGKILAGEIKSPGSYSIRTLGFLRSLSKADAEVISKIARFAVSGQIFRGKEEYLSKAGIEFPQLLFLQDIGILSGVSAIPLKTTFNSQEQGSFFKPLIASNKAMFLESSDQKKKATAEVYMLTAMGKEVLELASFRVDDQDFISVARDVVEKGFNVQVADWHQVNSEMGRSSNVIKVTAI